MVPLCLVRASLLVSGLECPFDPCRAKQRKDREAVINGAQPKQDDDPDVFPLYLPFSCSFIRRNCEVKQFCVLPALITETHKSKKWEEDRGKQDAHRRRESYLKGNRGARSGFLIHSSFGSLSPLMEKEKRDSARVRPEEPTEKEARRVRPRVWKG